MSFHIKHFTNLIHPILVIILGLIALIPNIYDQSFSAWDRSEFYLTALSQIIFIGGIAYYVYRNSLSPHWGRKYFINILTFGFLLYYLYGSTFHDASFPTLAVLLILSVAFLFILSIVNLIITLLTSGKYIKSNRL